jgi:signal transduction histidine kinase
MLNSGDQVLINIFYLLLPGLIILITVILVSFFYFKRLKRLIWRYRMQKMEEVETERKRIANDLHDYVGGKLIMIKSELHKSMQASQNPNRESIITQSISDLNKFHDELRHLVEYIYPKELMSGNIKEGFLRLASEMSSSTTEIIMDIELENQLPKDKTHQLYRLIQEKIANIVVHEKPPKVFIGLFENTNANEVMLSISYENKNPEKSIFKKTIKSGSGRGLFIIDERLKLLKARRKTQFNEGFFQETIIFKTK